LSTVVVLQYADSEISDVQKQAIEEKSVYRIKTIHTTAKVAQPDNFDSIVQPSFVESSDSRVFSMTLSLSLYDVSTKFRNTKEPWALPQRLLIALWNDSVQ